eukprot:5787890-Amphidinium_carterae.1
MKKVDDKTCPDYPDALGTHEEAKFASSHGSNLLKPGPLGAADGWLEGRGTQVPTSTPRHLC